MKNRKLPSRSSLLGTVLALTLGLSTAAFADLHNGVEVEAYCSARYDRDTTDWDQCVGEQCSKVHQNDPENIGPCIQNAIRAYDEEATPATR